MPKVKEQSVPLMDVRHDFINGFAASCNAASQLSRLVDSILEIHDKDGEIPPIAWQHLRDNNAEFKSAYWGND